MIKFQSFLSSSSGNCTFVTDDTTHILIDCGARLGYMEKCIMGENRRTTFPRWLIGEYYFSNEIDKSFIYSKKEVLIQIIQ